MVRQALNYIMAKEKINKVELVTKPSKIWQNFFYKLGMFERFEPNQWQEIQLLGYLCDRYEKLYGRKYSIAMKGAPGKCSEMYFVKNMIRTLNTSNMGVIKEYVDWVYDKKIIPENKKIKTFSFFMMAGLANEFLFHKQEDNIIKRSTELPNNYKEIANNLNVSVSTYGDLAFVKMAYDKYKNDLNNNYVQFFNNIEKIGFDIKVLERLAE